MKGQDNQVGLEWNTTTSGPHGGDHLLSEYINVVIKTRDFWLLIRSFGEKQMVI